MFLNDLFCALHRDARVPALAWIDHHVGSLLAQVHAAGAVHPRLPLLTMLLNVGFEFLEDLFPIPAGAATLARFPLMGADGNVL